MHLRLQRQKTEVEFRTSLGRDSIKYLKIYLAIRNDLTEEKPLFTKWADNEKRMTSGAVEAKFKEYASSLSYLKKKDQENGLNPARPHSSRAAFNSRLLGARAYRLGIDSG